jgi:hypothetical protein
MKQSWIQSKQVPEPQEVSWGWVWEAFKDSSGNKKSQLGQGEVETSENIL